MNIWKIMQVVKSMAMNVVYYYNDFQFGGVESNAWQHAIHVLTTYYLYDVYQDDDFIVLTNDVRMRNLTPYLVGKVNYDGSEVVFVGGFNLDDLKKCTDSVEFK